MPKPSPLSAVELPRHIDGRGPPLVKRQQAREQCIPQVRRGVLSAGELRDAILEACDHVRHAVATGDKDALRALHVQAKRHDQTTEATELTRDLEKLARYFPDPRTIDPARIRPSLVEVSDRRTVEGRLFRLLRAYWSMPFSKGYGRRLRFLVMDLHHEAVIGLIGLQSPPADLGCRDRYLGAEKPNKLAAANTTLDAYAVGASPTYAPLLGGKLVAGLIHSERIRRAYWRKYAGVSTVIANRLLSQPLLAVTTTSAFGRSSIYNRLRFHDELLAKPIGYTRGYGTVHLEALYPQIVGWLKDNHRHIPAGFGNGPKVRWQNIINALGLLGVPRSCLAHGVTREVFIFEFAKNLGQVHRSGEQPLMTRFDDDEWSNFWKERWCIKRANSNDEWSSFSAVDKMRAGLSDFQLLRP